MAKKKQKPEKSLTVRKPQARSQSLPSRMTTSLASRFFPHRGEASSAMRQYGHQLYMFWKRKISLSRKSSYQEYMRRT